MLPPRYKPVVLAVALAIAGCAGNGQGLDQNGLPIGSDESGSTPLTATFESIQANVFTPICTKCHIGAGAPEGLQLDAEHSYSLLVGVPSAEQSSVLRVSPGNPDASYVIRKLEDAAGISGGQMPLGGPYLPQATIDVIRQWITDGAAQTAMAAPGATAMSAAAPTSKAALTQALQADQLTVGMTSPDAGSIVAIPPSPIVVAFNHDVDPSVVNATTVVLERLGSAAEAPAALAATTGIATGNPATVAVTTRIATGNPAAVLIQPQTPLLDGVYRVTLRGTGGGALADMSARTLKTDYSFTFTVEVPR
ncbi:MAG TPA: Ig-like domain-containing protein [Steroidobacteraceae bacterium]|nr:Ig-like domain-containing protein [Steroidobacteraceae bacterium]